MKFYTNQAVVVKAGFGKGRHARIVGYDNNTKKYAVKFANSPLAGEYHYHEHNLVAA